MRRKNVFILTLFLLIAFLFCLGFNTVDVGASDGLNAKVYVKMLWSNSMEVNGIDVSSDGNYMAAVNGSGVYYFATNNSDLKWWYSQHDTFFSSVAVSADGDCVVAGTGDGYIFFFNDSIASSGEQSIPTWNSTQMYANIGTKRLDISYDGEYVVAGGFGTIFHYFNGCRGRSGFNEAPTWNSEGITMGYMRLDMSSDGTYIASGGNNLASNFVRFHQGANVTPYPTESSWSSSSEIKYGIQDVALSDDGFFVAGVDGSGIYGWANATTLTGDLNATWTCNGPFFSFDMSADGSNLVAGGTGLHFWANARERLGNQTLIGTNWTKIEFATVFDVAMSQDGAIVAALVRIPGDPYDFKAYFFNSNGSEIGEYYLAEDSRLVSMSGDGRVIAIAGFLSAENRLYIFEVLEDYTLPIIEVMYQHPANDTVTPDDEVTVYANVTDNESGVKQVTLNYSPDNEIWFIVNMTNLEGNTWNGTIPTFDYCTWVNYTITAEDKVGNVISSEEEFGYQHQYHVIPEFPSFLILPLFMITTLLAVIVYRRKHAM